jgi:hypothetical protein
MLIKTRFRRIIVLVAIGNHLTTAVRYEADALPMILKSILLGNFRIIQDRFLPFEM